MGRGRAPCCEKVGLKKGSWTPAEDMRLMAYIQQYGHGNWRALPKQAGLLRCGKSCRLRWINYLRPDIKRGNFTQEEEDTIIRLHEMLGNKWSKIASRLPGRTDNEIKNVWNTHLKKRLASREKIPAKDRPKHPLSSTSSDSSSSLSCGNQAAGDGSTGGEGGGALPADEDTSKPLDESSPENVIEIPMEANLDMWDMLEDASSQSDMRSSTDDMGMWDVVPADWDEQFPPKAPSPLRAEPAKRSLSASSSLSDITYCNTSEGLVQTAPQPWARPANADAVGQLPDITIEPELWNFLEDDPILFDDAPEGRGKQQAEEVNGNRWIAYLERELDLRGSPASPETTATNLVEPPEPGDGQGGPGAAEVDPISCYFQRQPPSPSPFSLTFTDISMT